MHVTTPGAGCGEGVLHLPTALERYPNRGIDFVYRVSGTSGAGTGKELLNEKTAAGMEAVRAAAVRRVIREWPMVESGSLSKDRRSLEEVVRHAKRYRRLVVAYCRNRLFRPAEHYREGGNKWAEPTAKDWRAWWRVVRGVAVATVLAPDTTEREQHSALTKLTGKAGRSGSISDELWPEVVAALGKRISRPQGWRWEHPVAEVAERFDLTENAIRHALRKSKF